jgi:hypothetical protein
LRIRFQFIGDDNRCSGGCDQVCNFVCKVF